MNASKRAAHLLKLAPPRRRALLERMSERQLRALGTHWRLWAHDGQLPPQGHWHCWLVMAGRGFGKTRAGAEWVRHIAESDPTARIALVAASLGEARSVMVEGGSGLLAISPPGMRPRFEPSRRVLTWPNGAEARLYSAGEPESLRGPQHSHAFGTVAEGVLRQRGACDHRRAAASGDRRPSGQPACNAAGRRMLAGRFDARRRLGGSCRRSGVLPGRDLDLCRTA